MDLIGIVVELVMKLCKFFKVDYALKVKCFKDTYSQFLMLVKKFKDFLGVTSQVNLKLNGNILDVKMNGHIHLFLIISILKKQNN